MFRGDIRKQPPHDRTKSRGQKADQSGLLGQSHDSEPQGHDSGERQGQRHYRGLAGLKGGTCYLGELSGYRPEQDSQQDEPEPNPIALSLPYSFGRQLAQTIYVQTADLASDSIFRRKIGRLPPLVPVLQGTT